MKKIISILSIVICFCTGCHKETPQLSYAAQLQKDDGLIDQYLASQNIIAVKDTNGLRYVITSLGTGIKPVLSGKVTLGLIGSFLNGNVFLQDSTPQVYPVDNFIKGIEDGLQLIPKGSRFTLYVPSGLGYGTSGSPDGIVPGNAILVYSMYLFDDDAQLKEDKETIDNYLKSQNIQGVVKDSSGLRYVINTPGSGDYPEADNTVTVTYSGSILAYYGYYQVTEFTDESRIQVLLSNTIQGFQLGVQFINTGGTITLYIPSGLGYGPAGSSDGTIGANANLIYNVQLNFFN